MCGHRLKFWKTKADLAAQAVDLAVVGGDQVAVLGGLELEGFAGNQDFALVRVFEQVDAAQQGGLAGAGRPQDGDHVTVACGQRNALENFLLAVAFVQIADFQRGRGLSHVRSSCDTGAFPAVGGLPGVRHASIAALSRPTGSLGTRGAGGAVCRIVAAQRRADVREGVAQHQSLDEKRRDGASFGPLMEAVLDLSRARPLPQVL